MKRIIALSLLICLNACELSQMQENLCADIEYIGCIEEEGTKVYLEDYQSVRWEAAQQMAIFEKRTQASLFEVSSESQGKTTADFDRLTQGTLTEPLGHNVAICPAMADVCTSAGEGVYIFEGVTMPSVQVYAEDSFDSASFPMVAVSDDNNLTFKNVAGGIRLQVKGNGVVRSICLRGNNNEYISGKADIYAYSDARKPVVRMQNAARKEVTLDCGPGVGLDPDIPTDFVLTLPPTDFSKGFSVVLTDDAGRQMTMTASVQNIVERSSLLKMPEFTFAPVAVEEKVLTECPFTRGINLSDWMLHTAKDYVLSNSYIEQDFHNLKSLGFDAVRLPVNFKAHVGASPDYIIEDYLFESIDKAVNYAENAGLYIIIDNHSYLGESFPNEGPAVLKKVFAQIAERYKNRSDKVIYELFNEPNESDLSLRLLWGSLQPALIDIIRKVDASRTIIVSGFGSSIDKLEGISSLVGKDRNLIYTFHFYAPSLFTHQGADWGNSPMQYLSSPVPFPYDADRMPSKPTEFIGSYNESDYDDYPQIGNVEYLRCRIQKAVDFSRTYGVPVYCGEWGVLNRLAADEDYCNYHKVVREMLEDSDIAWTLWAYRDDFSIFKRGSGYIFENDLNIGLIEALGLDIPPSYESSKAAEICFYDDAVMSCCNVDNYASDLNIEYKSGPYSGERCIRWVPSGRYGSLTFELWPVSDFTPQAELDYDLTFMIRTNDPVSNLTVRFLEYDSQVKVPWRYVYLIGNNLFPSDGQWHQVRIPMSYFWNNGANTNPWTEKDPSRPCDWVHINKIEFALEGQQGLIGADICIDDIRLTAPENKNYIKSFKNTETVWGW